jgi:glycosyltransferase involved in cell wall biosynthesis
MTADVDVMIARSNSIVNSPRVRKIAGSLKNKYRIRVVGWNREGLPKEESRTFITDLDLLNFKGPIGRTILVLYLPIFWIYLFAKLVKYQPNVVHACDLDTLPPSIVFKVLFRKTLVFDVCDRYALSKISPSRRLLFSFVNWVEEYLGQKSDYMINVTEKMAGTFKRKPKKTGVIMNCADDNLRRFMKINDGFKASAVKGNSLTLVYTGHIVRNRRGLELLSSAIKKMEGVQLLMAGAVIDQEFLDELIAQQNIKYCGHLPFHEAIGLESIADVLVALYDKNIPNYRYGIPNKLFDAMMFGVPIITNIAEEIIQRTDCGVLIDNEKAGEVAKAITSLRTDPQLRRRMGENGRLAFQERYNWSAMEKKLFDIYEELQIWQGR